ncbi:MAG: DUF1289 domain-containing protein [Gammaproteobacteria bacterium]|nr:DUF1289 domain-containing protein [Gammaproteobacteria bacterium]
MTEPPVASPCVRQCCLDDQDICLGCHRSVDEIIAWGNADNAARRAILQRAAARARAWRQRYRPFVTDN